MRRGIKRDYKALLKYARALGVRVVFQRVGKKNPDAGYFIYDAKDPRIQVNVGSKLSDTERVLTLLHELGHALDYISSRRKLGKTISKVLDKEQLKMSKRERTVFKSFEAKGISNMSTIANLLGLSIPMWRVRAEQSLDLWIYTQFEATGTFPDKKEMRAKRKEFEREERAK